MKARTFDKKGRNGFEFQKQNRKRYSSILNFLGTTAPRSFFHLCLHISPSFLPRFANSYCYESFCHFLYRGVSARSGNFLNNTGTESCFSFEGGKASCSEPRFLSSASTKAELDKLGCDERGRQKPEEQKSIQLERTYCLCEGIAIIDNSRYGVRGPNSSALFSLKT